MILAWVCKHLYPSFINPTVHPLWNLYILKDNDYMNFRRNERVVWSVLKFSTTCVKILLRNCLRLFRTRASFICLASCLDGSAMIPIQFKTYCLAFTTMVALVACSSKDSEPAPATPSSPSAPVAPSDRGGAKPGAVTPVVQERGVTIDPIGALDERPYPFIPIESQSEIKAIVESATVECSDLKDCPESAALLIGADHTSVFQCSATHIGNGYFSTDSRCLPSSLNRGSNFLVSDCKDSIWVKFPATETKSAATLNCDKIVIASTSDENQKPKESREMMVFKVQGVVDRAAVSGSWSESPQDGDVVTFWPADPDKNRLGINGIILRKTCAITDKRGLEEVLDYMGWSYPVSYLKDCSAEIVKGNSGSTAVSAQGLAALLINQAVGVEEKTGAGSNYLCFNFILDGHEIIERGVGDCQWISDEVLKGLKANLDEEASLQESAEIQAYIETIFNLHNNFYGAENGKREALESQYFSTSFSDLVNASGNADLQQAAIALEPYVSHFQDVTFYSNDLPGSADSELILSSGKVKTFGQDAKAFHSGVELQHLNIPECIGPLTQETLDQYRADSKWNFFSSVAFSPVTFRIPVGVLSIERLENSPSQVKWNELDQIKLEKVESLKIPLSTVFEITLSGFTGYRSSGFHITNASVEVKEIEDPSLGEKSLKDFSFYPQVVERVNALSICQ